MKKTGPWRLADGYLEKNGLKVFSTFACAGGSTMGWKLAGYDVVGCVEIDPRVYDVYKHNHNPRFGFNESISDFNKRKNIPKELIGIDILDGSPPCSSFSIAGSREKKWGEKKKFREGQAEQVLDDLFFEFLNTVELLQPKVVVAENVKGMLIGKAKGYTLEVVQSLQKLGYQVSVYLLNASHLGVPQCRERVFFIANKEKKPNLLFEKEPQIAVEKAFAGCPIDKKESLTEHMKKFWQLTKAGEKLSSIHPKGSLFNYYKLHPKKPSFTLTATNSLMHYQYPRYLNVQEKIRISTFPEDLDFRKENPGYLMGMSVPPFMMQRVALAVAEDLFEVSNAKKKS